MSRRRLGRERAKGTEEPATTLEPDPGRAAHADDVLRLLHVDVPTIDRIDPDKDYTLDNIRVITRSENSRRARRRV